MGSATGGDRQEMGEDGVLPNPARSRCSRPSLPARRLGRIGGLARPNIGAPLEGEALGAAGGLMN